jgi:acetolactate synthase-1/2/3 large subunit
MDVANILVKILSEYGIKTFFGVPGHHTLPLYKALYDLKLRHILFHEEVNAGFAADGYSKLSGLIGVVDATAGPGILRVIPAVAESFASSTPLLIIAGDVDLPYIYSYKYGRSHVAQHVDQISMLKPITKAQYIVTSPSYILPTINQAIRTAVSGRPGPVLVDIPVNVFWGEYNSQDLEPIENVSVLRITPSSELIQKAANLIRASKKPILICGGGIHLAQAWDEVYFFMDKYRIPVVTTITGKGAVPEVHPLSLGIIGDLGGWFSAYQAVMESDLVIAIGTKFSQYSTYNWELLKSKRIIHIDVDPEELGRSFHEDVSIIGDAKISLSLLLTMLHDWRVNDDWVRYVKKLKDEFMRKLIYQMHEDNRAQSVTPKHVMMVLNEVCGEDDLLVSDASSSSGWTARYYIVKSGGRNYLAPRGIAGLGYGLPAAIGAYSTGNVKGKVVVVTGDGGFGYYVSELETLKRTGYPILVVVLNDSALGWIKLEQIILQEGKVYSSEFLEIDYSKIARDYGIEAFRVQKPSELVNVIKTAYEHEGPSLVDVKVTTDPTFIDSLTKLFYES